MWFHNYAIPSPPFSSLWWKSFCTKYIFPCMNMEFVRRRKVEKKKGLGTFLQLWEKFIQKSKNACIPITICRKCCFCSLYMLGKAQQFAFFVAVVSCASFFIVAFLSLPISHMGIFIPWALFSLHLYFQCPCFVSSSFFLNNPIHLYFLMFCFQKHLEILLKGTPTYL